MKDLSLRLKRLNYLKIFFIVLSLFTFVKAEQTTILEPKIIEYKGVKEERIRKIEGQIYSLYQKQKNLEDKISQIENLKNISTDKQHSSSLLANLEDIKQNLEEIKKNQESINKEIKDFRADVHKVLLIQNLIQFIIFAIFTIMMYLLYKYKKAETSQIEEKEKIPQENQSDSDIIKALTEKAKEDPKVAEVLKAYLNTRRIDDEV